MSDRLPRFIKSWTAMQSRCNLFGRLQVLQGDRTSHGGTVISGSPQNIFYDKPVARKGDQVYCPQCKPHYFEIQEGLENCLDMDLPMAAEGHRTTCGALLIAEPSSPTALQNIACHRSGSGHDDYYTLRDAQGNAMADTYYGCEINGGPIEYATTNAEGQTHLCLSGEHPAEIKIYVAG